MDLCTCDSIIADMTSVIMKKEVLPPEKYLENAFYLNILSLSEYTKLNEMEYEIAKIKSQYIKEGHSNADSKNLAQATEQYMHMKNQESKLKVVKETVLLAKKWAGMIHSESYGGL